MLLVAYLRNTIDAIPRSVFEWGDLLAGSTHQLSPVFSQETMEDAFIFPRQTMLFYMTLRPTHQFIETGNVVTHLNLKLAVTVEPFNEESILFFVDCDAFHSNLI
jgi:hypothetical protein